MKHTKGPWAIGIETNEEQAQIITSDGWHMATISHYPIMENARLIAAAPELLEAAKGAIAALTQNKTYQADIDSAKAMLQYAIAKAEGESCE